MYNTVHDSLNRVIYLFDDNLVDIKNPAAIELSFEGEWFDESYMYIHSEVRAIKENTSVRMLDKDLSGEDVLLDDMSTYELLAYINSRLETDSEKTVR